MASKKILAVWRHGRAGQPMHTADFDRPLTDRGIRELNERVTKLEPWGLADRIVCSAALRTSMTAELISDALSFGHAGIEREEHLYNASTGDWLDLVASFAQEEFVILVGHNPAISTFCQTLSDDLAFFLSPGECRVFEFKQWTDSSAKTIKDIR